MMTQPKREKLVSNNKDTRWDRIRKRYSSNTTTNLKSDTVKKFIEFDYIGRHQQNVLNGNSQMDKNLDPNLVMNLRHEMRFHIRQLSCASLYSNDSKSLLPIQADLTIHINKQKTWARYLRNYFKKIPRKLPLATIAYSNNLQQCKDHNVAVEDRYIENQLNQFRKHLQKQHNQNKVPLRKAHPLLIDNTNIINSLESTHKHIEDFYNAPIDAFQQVQDLFTGELSKHKKYESLSESESTDLTDTHLLNHLDNSDIMEENNKISFNVREETETKSEENEINFMAERRINEFILDNEIFQSELKPNENRQRTPSPLENTYEVLKPLRQAIEDPAVSHLKFVRFDDDCNASHIKRESSICSNTSDGIDSVISDLAEEALKELEIEEGVTFMGNLEKNTSKIAECPYELTEENNAKPLITRKIVPYERLSIKEIQLTSVPLKSPEASYPIEQSKIIKDLFQSRVQNKTSILRKYFLKWVHYTTIEKIERDHVDIRADRVKRINIFLNKIRIEKKRLRNCNNEQTDSVFAKDGSKSDQKKEPLENIKINKKYQNKIKVQQDIIDLQRLKLERQERIIMELKLHKLSEESKEARQELKNELKTVIRSGDPKSKAKAKCLQLIGNLKDEEDENLSKLQGKSLLMPKFLQNMQERAFERDVRHQQAKQRRLHQEAEREAQKLALEEAKRLEGEEAKRLRIEALKEKRRQEKMAKVIKERERQKYLENQQKAQDFYKRLLLQRIGMEGFKRLIQRKKDNLRKCEELRQSLFKKTYFQAWFCLYRINKARRNQKADELYEKCLKRQCIHIWLKYIHEERSKFHVAVDYNELKLTESMFQKWWAYVKRMQMIEETKMKQAISHHEWHLKWKVIDCWQRLPQILQLEKETEERRQRWRLKIWELLPDYTPNRDDFNYM